MIKRAMKKYNKLSLSLVLLGLAISICSVMGIVYFQKLLDSLTNAFTIYNKANDIIHHISIVLLMYGLFCISDCILNYVYEYPYVKLSNALYQHFRISAIRKISNVDYYSLQKSGTGQIIQIVENGAAAGRDIIINYYMSIFGWQLPKALLSVFVLGTYNFQVMAIIAIGYVLVFLVTKILLKKLYTLKDAIVTNQEAMSRRFVNCLMEIITFRINRLYKQEIFRLEKDADKITEDTTKIKLIHEAFFAIFYLIIILIKIVIIVASILYSQDITVGMLVAMVTLVDNIYNPIALFNVAYVDYSLNKISFKRYEKFMDLKDDTNLYFGKEIPLDIKRICFDKVSFSYKERKVVNNVSFVVEPQKAIAVVGESGSGKSTIIKLLLGLLKSNDGNIYVDGIDINKIKLINYYQSITYISQETPVFDASIRRNITLGKCIPEDQIFDVLSLVKLTDLVQNQPNKLDEEIGEKGVKLSGGEKQRLALARIFFDNSKVVILDEATAGLDYITEEFVMKNILQYIKNKILIIIAHRLNIVKDVSNILVMRNGEIIEEGNFEQLINDKGSYFSALWEKRNSFIE